MRRYLFKLYPIPAQAALLDEQCRMMGDLWNALKQRIEDVYRRERKMLTYFDLTNEITGLRQECPEWRAVPAVTAHRVAKHLTDAYKAFFRRVKTGAAPGYPDWHRRDRATAIPLGTMGKTGWRLEQRGDNPLSWRLHYGGVSDVRDTATWLHARGRIPARREPGANPQSDISLRRWRSENAVAVSDWRNADIIRRDGDWWLSVCVEIAPRRTAGRYRAQVAFDLIDSFAAVNGIAEYPPELGRAMALQERADELKRARDERWPRRTRLGDGDKAALGEANGEIAGLLAKAARIRKDALHVWTARLVAQSSEIVVKSPRPRERLRSGKGTAQSWGANVATVAALNREALNQAPGITIEMLRYKAEEAGIRCVVEGDDEPKIAVGGELVAAGRQLRRVRRQLKRNAA